MDDREKKFELSLTAQRLDYLFNVLMQRPYGEVAGLIAELQQQLAHQRVGNGQDTHREMTQ